MAVSKIAPRKKCCLIYFLISEVQFGQRVALSGISEKQWGHFLVSGGNSLPDLAKATSLFIGKTTKK